MTLCPPPELLTDSYQLTMAASYLAQGTASDRVAFELFVRELPRDRGYLVAAGLETAERYLQELHFDDSSLDYLERSGTCVGPLLDELRGLRFDGEGTHVSPLAGSAWYLRERERISDAIR